MKCAISLWAVLGTAFPVAAQQPVQPAPLPTPSPDTVYCFVRSDSLPLEGPCAGLKVVVDARPEIVRQGVAEYPPQLRAAGVQGEVVVQMIVDTSGGPELESVTIVQTPHPDFEPAVRAFVATLEFRPRACSRRASRTFRRSSSRTRTPRCAGGPPACGAVRAGAVGRRAGAHARGCALRFRGGRDELGSVGAAGGKLTGLSSFCNLRPTSGSAARGTIT